MKVLTQERLKEVLVLDPDKGRFFWKKKHAGIPHGKEAGSVDGRGIRQVKVDQRIYKEHFLVWLYVYGERCENIHHINHDLLDNRPVNLCKTQIKDIAKNKEMLRRNTSGFTGVTRRNRSTFIAQITVNGRNIYLGSFRKIEDAIVARKKANKKYGFHENHGLKLVDRLDSA